MNDRWARHFLKRALLVSEMSKDINTRVGAIVVDPFNVQRADGYNGLPRRVADTPERLEDREMKLRLTVHAERNAILNAARTGVSTRGCTLLMAATDDTGAVWSSNPCTACSIELIQAGIIEIVGYPGKNGFSKWHDDLAFARTILVEAGVRLREIEP